MSKKVYQVTGDIKGKFISNVNVSDSHNTETSPQLIEDTIDCHSSNYDEARGYGCVTLVISTVAIFLSVISLLKWDGKLCCMSGENITIATLSTLVTLLVAWQIYATIKARQEVKEARDEAERRLVERMKNFEECCNERGRQIDAINESKETFEHNIASKVDIKYRAYEARLYFAQATTLSLFADLEMRLKDDSYKPLDENTKEVKFQYSMAYRYYFEALLYYALSKENYTAMDACISNMQTNLNRLSTSDEKFEISAYSRCDSLYDKFISIAAENHIDKGLVERLKILHEKRVKITPYDISKETGIKVVTVEADSEAAQHLFRIVREARDKRIAEEKARKESNSDPNSPVPES